MGARRLKATIPEREKKKAYGSIKVGEGEHLNVVYPPLNMGLIEILSSFTF